MTAHTRHLAPALRTAALAAAMGWFALWSWHGLIEQAPRFLWPALFAGVLIAVTGVLARSFRLGWYGALVAQLAVVLVWFHHHIGIGGSLGGWLPTPTSLTDLVRRVHAGGAAVQRYSSPVSSDRPEAVVYLLAAAIVVLLAVDLIACGLKRPPWSGLPVIITLTIPISVLDGPLAWPVFVGTAMFYVLLVAAGETDRLLTWGAAVTGHRARPGEPEQILDRASARGRAVRIGALTTAGALVLPVFVPVAHGLLDGGKGNRSHAGSSQQVVLDNPLVDLRRDLVSNDHTPLLYARTDSADPTYLRTTVLDEFNGTAWLPSSRSLPATNLASGRLPDPAGITSTTPGVTSSWSLRTSPDFVTSWLPTPFPTRTITIDRGDWRYAVDTLDIADTDTTVPVEVSYNLTAFSPRVDPAALDSAGPAPETIQVPMTKLPNGLPTEVIDIARQVTSAATTVYGKAVLLQNWFRSTGGFRYSLAPAAGDGMAQLDRFITTEKVGYCEQFAAAMGIMARALKIPSRVVVGFLSPELRNATGNYTYTSDDLHAWPEIYFRGSGWVRFEPTPSTRTGSAPSWTRGVSNQPPPDLPTSIPSTVTSKPVPRDKPVSPSSTGQNSGRGIEFPAELAIAALLVLAAGFPRVLRDAQRRRRLRPRGDARAEVDELWAELRATALDLRIDWPRGRSVREIGQVLTKRAGAQLEAVGALEGLVELVERARYAGTFEFDDQARTAARRTLATWSALLAGSVATRSARSARFLPLSAFDRRNRVVEIDDRSTTLTEVS